MSTSGIVATALEFLESIDPDDSIWDDGGIEQFVEKVHALATQKRLARKRFAIRWAIAALRAEVDNLPTGDVVKELIALESAGVASLNPGVLVSQIEALTGAVTAYRQQITRTTDGSPRTVTERAAMYQTMGSSLALISKCHAELVNALPGSFEPEPSATSSQQLIHRRHSKSTPVSRELWTVAFFLASCGHRVDDGPADPPMEFGPVKWGNVFASFYQILGAGRDQEQFRKSLSNLRDYYDAFVDSGRKGWDPKTSPMPRLGHIVMTDWKNRPREELWEYVKQFVTR
jgi:hypothetical protein